MKTNFYFNPFIGLHIKAFKNITGINQEINRAKEIVISLYSPRESFQLLPLTLLSLLDQKLKADKIILWLDSEYEDLAYLPYEITQFIKNGIEIKFVKSLGNYTKTIYALKEYKDSIVITADSNIYYSRNWLEKLYLSYIANPDDIQVHNALLIKLQDKELQHFKTWSTNVKEDSASYFNFPIGASGILYPPNCFKSEAFREDIFLNNVICNDDLWFWTMALVYNRKIRVVNNHIKKILTTDFFNFVFKDNIKEKIFDNELANILVFYKQNIINKLNTLAK